MWVETKYKEIVNLDKISRIYIRQEYGEWHLKADDFCLGASSEKEEAIAMYELLRSRLADVIFAQWTQPNGAVDHLIAMHAELGVGEQEGES
jgi:hypothetical protein